MSLENVLKKHFECMQIHKSQSSLIVLQSLQTILFVFITKLKQTYIMFEKKKKNFYVVNTLNTFK